MAKSRFENLPEIKRRKDEERKKQEAQEKKERIAKYNKECKARSRAQLKKKREAAAASSQVGEAGSGNFTSQAAKPVATAQITLTPASSTVHH